MTLPRAQFGQIASSYTDIKAANMAVYTIFPNRSLAGGFRTAVQSLLKGNSTMYTNSSKIGIGRSFFRKVLVDLETMKVLKADPARGRAIPVADMIKACKDLDTGNPGNPG